MRVKICGITQPQQSLAIASLGATDIGFICVSKSPRYVTIQQIQIAVEPLPRKINKIGVFVNSDLTEIRQVVTASGLTGVQLHGDEPPQFCSQLRQVLPKVEIIKALRVRNLEHLQTTYQYTDVVDTLLLDAYHPQQLGGTGQTLDWQMLQKFKPSRPWFLAGGLKPENITEALSKLHPDGIDLSSGVENSPGDKNLDQVALLFQQLKSINF
ncbi:MAG: phosphoribosylanthranilate isomerase [Sphaerospermopsis sp. SIO1G2]|nr:phosphoribosylanthranilate isomerase [Sphaerospermopsis sp. SIO1G1]NET73742.1 phosphoribosylanthranilate isomerase [Sphaerospermopsis sp. SIO1G2]